LIFLTYYAGDLGAASQLIPRKPVSIAPSGTYHVKMEYLKGKMISQYIKIMYLYYFSTF